MRRLAQKDLTLFGADFEEEGERSVPRWLIEDGIPSGVAEVSVLNAVGPLDSFAPTFAIVIARPDPDVFVFFVRATEPGDDEAAACFGNSGSVTGEMRRLGKDEVFAEESRETRWRNLGGRIRFEGFGRVAKAVFVFDEVEPPVLSADDEVGFPVFIEVTNGRAAGVSGDVAFGEVADFF